MIVVEVWILLVSLVCLSAVNVYWTLILIYAEYSLVVGGGYEVICFSKFFPSFSLSISTIANKPKVADVGQEEDFEAAKEKALKIGASRSTLRISARSLLRSSASPPFSAMRYTRMFTSSVSHPYIPTNFVI